jgi:hypothetical protein
MAELQAQHLQRRVRTTPHSPFHVKQRRRAVRDMGDGLILQAEIGPHPHPEPP